MKARKNKPFSLSVLDVDCFNDDQAKFQICYCPQSVKSCDSILNKINESFLEFSIFQRNKEYSRGINSLQNAFYFADSIQKSDCGKCKKAIKNSIIETLNNLCSELKYMSSGFFTKKRYQESSILADKLFKKLNNNPFSKQDFFILKEDQVESKLVV